MRIPNRKTAIKKDVAHRQAVKKKWDRHCQYSSAEEYPAQIDGEAEFTAATDFEAGGDNWTRLLDEGVVVDSGDWPFGVIRKGVIKKFYDDLPENFEGYIDKDHIRAFYLGKYTKKDLRVVELEDGRYALEVNIKLDRSLYAVQDLLKEDFHRALSVEMFIKADEYATLSKVSGMSEKEVEEKYGWDPLVPLIDDIGIEGFAICEDPKNANSYNEDLLENASASEGDDMTKELKELKAKEDAEAKKVEASVDETEGQKSENTDEDVENTDNADTAENEGKKEDVKANTDDAEKTDDESDKEEDKLDQLSAAIADMKKDLEAKDAKIAELEAQLAAQKEAKMSNEDRLAELIGMATVSKQGATEGKSTNNEAGSVAEIYRQAFAE